VEDFWGRFLRYRFDFAALAFDCVATFFSPGKPFGRMLALFGALLMLVPPVFILIAGDEKFGDGWAFGITLAFFVVVIEAPGHMWRRGIANGGSVDDKTFDAFLFALLSVMGVTAPFVLLDVEVESGILLGVVWGVALVGAQDLVRSGIAFALALARGRPVYER
jgi:hypothetical protein